jgi:hypothetical protein
MADAPHNATFTYYFGRRYNTLEEIQAEAERRHNLGYYVHHEHLGDIHYEELKHNEKEEKEPPPPPPTPFEYESPNEDQKKEKKIEPPIILLPAHMADRPPIYRIGARDLNLDRLIISPQK